MPWDVQPCCCMILAKPKRGETVNKPQTLWPPSPNLTPKGPAANQDHLWTEEQIQAKLPKAKRKLKRKGQR